MKMKCYLVLITNPVLTLLTCINASFIERKTIFVNKEYELVNFCILFLFIIDKLLTYRRGGRRGRMWSFKKETSFLYHNNLFSRITTVLTRYKSSSLVEKWLKINLSHK